MSSQERGPAPAETQSVYHIYMAAIAMLAIMVAIGLYVAPTEPDIVGVLEIVDFILCLVFAFDFLRSLVKARSKLRYLGTWGWLDLVTCIPFIVEARWLRLARLMRLLVLVRAVHTLWKSSQVDRRSIVMAAATFAIQALFVLLCVLTLYFEHGAPKATITSAGDTLWWAITTVTTVGYGDEYPVTPGGRICGAILMLSGISYLATVLGVISQAAHPKRPGS